MKRQVFLLRFKKGKMELVPHPRLKTKWYPKKPKGKKQK